MQESPPHGLERSVFFLILISLLFFCLFESLRDQSTRQLPFPFPLQGLKQQRSDPLQDSIAACFLCRDIPMKQRSCVQRLCYSDRDGGGTVELEPPPEDATPLVRHLPVGLIGQGSPASPPKVACRPPQPCKCAVLKVFRSSRSRESNRPLNYKHDCQKHQQRLTTFCGTSSFGHMLSAYDDESAHSCVEMSSAMVPDCYFHASRCHILVIIVVVILHIRSLILWWL
eukprot:4253772-Amphidinium_carterae.1